MKRIPTGIQLELGMVGVASENHEKILNAMADEGDWYAVHWRTCGLLSGVLASKMCHQGHKIGPGANELSRARVKELATELGLVDAPVHE